MPTDGGIFTGDPFTGLGTVTYSDGTQVDMSYRDFTGGLLDVQGGQRFDVYNTFNRTTIGQQGPFTSERLANNTFTMISETRRGTVNSAATSGTMRIASGTISVQLPNGETLDHDFSQIPVAAAGYQWAMVLRSDGTLVPTRVPAMYLSNEQLQADFNASWRLATAEEVIFNAAAFSIAKERAGDLVNVAHDLGIDPEGELSTYDLMQNLLYRVGSVTNIRTFSSIFPA